ncbi:MAG: FAD synthase [Epsilonproteobacteria bacterium]|nr:FAD synthase [Campylobacterota bacterium]
MNIYTGGTFDVLHAGHINFLRQCSDLAGSGEVIVSLNTDEFITEYKKKPPLYSYKERAKLLILLNYVNKIIPNTGGADSKPAILSVNPDLIAIGDDWLSKDYFKQMGFTKEWLQAQEIGLCYLPYTKGISTSDIKKRCNKL